MIDNFLLLRQGIIYSNVFADPCVFQLFIWLLLSANHNCESRLIRTGRGCTVVEIKAGQVVVGQNSIAHRLGIPRSTLGARLNRLREMGAINFETESHYTIIKIENFAQFQADSST